MKKHLFLICGLIFSASAKAQFHTVENNAARFAIERVSDNGAKVGNENMAMDADNAQPVVVDTVSWHKRWIDQYLSVSYPLKSVHITSGFGRRCDPFTHKAANHNGLDLRADNEEVYAMMFGRVEKVGRDKRSGLYVTLRHADYLVSYCHLSRVQVSKGDLVYPGQPVGVSGNTGRSTGPHLHITLRKGCKTLNPQILLDYVRLLRQEAIAALAHP